LFHLSAPCQSLGLVLPGLFFFHSLQLCSCFVSNTLLSCVGSDFVAHFLSHCSVVLPVVEVVDFAFCLSSCCCSCARWLECRVNRIQVFNFTV
jgi:hypothetical protein